MIEVNKKTSTGEPVEGQAPAPGTDTKGPTSTAPAQTAEKTASTSGTLPAGYLSNGSMVDGEGVMLPEYLDKYAQELAGKLKSISSSTFQRAFLTKAKEANRKNTPYSTKKNCAQGMVIAALKLVNRKKDPAPAVLLDMVKLATATVVDDASFSNLYLHLDAVYTYMLME